MRNIFSKKQVRTMNFLHFLIHFLLRLANIIAVSDTHEYTTSVGYQATIFDRGAHMQNQSVEIIQAGNLCAFSVCSRIAL